MALPQPIEERHFAAREHPRAPFWDPLGIPVTIMQFGEIHRHDITVHGTDISDGGIGIVSDAPIACGFVWFWRVVGGQKGGMVMWSRKIKGRYRAGIKFLPIPLSAEGLLTTAD